MEAPDWFGESSVLGSQPPLQAAAKLREMGEDEAASALERAGGRVQHTFGLLDWWKGTDKAWQHTAHAFGYFASSNSKKKMLPIKYAGQVEPDLTLKNSKIKITLDRLRIADYPGSGTHRVLFDFYAQNQLPQKNVEHLHFNTTFRAREGEEVATIGYPIFVGLSVASEGVALKCYTVNVKNDDDEAMLEFMESDIWKTGLRLISTAQPAIAPLSKMAFGLTQSIAKRNRNVPVQDFYLGLDFSNIASRARLREGSYIAVQIPQKMKLIWDWKDWGYDMSSGCIVSQDDTQQLIPYNYVVIGVSRHEQ